MDGRVNHYFFFSVSSLIDVNSFYINITNPRGATQGYGGSFIPLQYRIFFEKGNFYGCECLRGMFNSQLELNVFLKQISTQASGTFGVLFWQQEQPA